MLLAPATTWALVTMSPFASKVTPEPRPWSVRICATDGWVSMTTLTNCCSSDAPGTWGEEGLPVVIVLVGALALPPHPETTSAVAPRMAAV
jgi:hypothetical protein